ERGVGQRHPARRVNRNYSGRDALEDGFDVPAPAFERLVRGANIAVGSLDLAPAGFELFRHAVERLHQFGQFVGGAEIASVPAASAATGRLTNFESRSASQVEANSTTTVSSSRNPMYVRRNNF